MVGRTAFLLICMAWLVLLPAVARAQGNRVPVVATFSILADLVRQVGGDRVQVVSLIGPDGSAHGFEPSPSDAGRVAAARLVIANGLGFEGWVDRLVKASGGKAALVIAAREVKPIAGGENGADPHAFQSVSNAKLYVAAIRDALTTADPEGRAEYGARAAAYLAELKKLDVEVRAAIAAIPAERRRVITSHDAFGYFAADYGIRFIAPRGVSGDSEVSARDVARIIRQVRAENVPAVFIENVSDPRLMQRIATETGARIGGKLYSDALSAPAGPAGTYVELMRHNIHMLAAALAR